jgi:uncharacterized protein YndB with AHSA1/START domain
MTLMNTKPTTVQLQRIIPAPPARVYRAWHDPELLRRWLAPADYTVTRVEVDERVGGRHRIWQAGPEGDVGGFDCELLELVPNQRIVFLWRFVGPDRQFDPTHDSRLTITLQEAAGGATTLTLVHERLGALQAVMPEIVAGVEEGWGMALDKLTAAVGQAA